MCVVVYAALKSLFLALWSNYFKSDFRLSSLQQNGAFDEVGFANVVAVDVRHNVAAYHAFVLVHLTAGQLIKKNHPTLGSFD